MACGSRLAERTTGRVTAARFVSDSTRRSSTLPRGRCRTSGLSSTMAAWLSLGSVCETRQFLRCGERPMSRIRCGSFWRLLVALLVSLLAVSGRAEGGAAGGSKDEALTGKSHGSLTLEWKNLYGHNISRVTSNSWGAGLSHNEWQRFAVEEKAPPGAAELTSTRPPALGAVVCGERRNHAGRE